MQQGTKRIILEIGHGGNSLPRKAFILPNQTYLGIDNPKGILSRLKVSSAEHSRRKFDSLTGGRKVFFARADGSAIPVKDASVSEIHVHNVFNDARIPEDSAAKFITEAQRALKTGGKLYVYTNYPGLFITRKKLKEIRKALVTESKAGSIRATDATRKYDGIIRLVSASKTRFSEFIDEFPKSGFNSEVINALSKFRRVKTGGTGMLKEELDRNTGRKGELLVFEKKEQKKQNEA